MAAFTAFARLSWPIASTHRGPSEVSLHQRKLGKITPSHKKNNARSVMNSGWQRPGITALCISMIKMSINKLIMI